MSFDQDQPDEAYLFPDWDTPIKVGRRLLWSGRKHVWLCRAHCGWAPKVALCGVLTGCQQAEEIEHAKERSYFQFAHQSVKIIGDENGWVKGWNVSGWNWVSRRIRGASLSPSRFEFMFDVETVVIAIGNS